MPAEPLAEASVRVRPDTRGFRDELQRGVEDSGAADLGEKQGGLYGGKFAEEAKRSLTKALSDLPEVKIDADSTEADLKLAAIRAELDALSHEEIGVTIDDHLLLAQVARIKAELAGLGKTGSARLQLDTKSAIADLDKLGKDVLPTVEKAGVNAGESFSRGLLSEVQGGVSSLGEAGFTNPIVLAALAPAVVEAGAAVGGLFLTGIGLAGIGAGIAGQIHDPQVQLAGTILGRDVASGFKKATSGFAAPVAGELNDLSREWAKLEPGVERTFDKLAPLVHDLGDGAEGFVDKLVPGLEDAAVAAGPLVQTLSKWLPQFGGELANLFEVLANNSDTLNDGLGLALGTISAIVDALAVGAQVGSWLFEAAKWTTGGLHAIIDLGRASDGTVVQLRTLGDTAQDAGSKAAGSVPDYDALSKSLNQVSLDADDLAAQMTDKVIDAFLAADHAALSLAEAQTRLSDALKENGHAFGDHTKASQANHEAILAVVAANRAEYDSMIKTGSSAQEAAAAYDKNTASLERQLQKAHYTKDEIQQLIGKYRAVPDTVNTEIAAHGLADAIDRLGLLLAKLNGLDGSVFGFFLHGYTEIDPISSHHDSIPGRAIGGPVEPFRDYIVGEHGKEILRMGAAPGVVIPNHDLGRLAPSAGGGSSAGGFDSGLIAELLAEQRRTNALLSALSLSVSADELALLVRKGNKNLTYAGG